MKLPSDGSTGPVFGTFTVTVSDEAAQRLEAASRLEAEDLLGSFTPTGQSGTPIICENGQPVALVQRAACAFRCHCAPEKKNDLCFDDAGSGQRSTTSSPQPERRPPRPSGKNSVMGGVKSLRPLQQQSIYPKRSHCFAWRWSLALQIPQRIQPGPALQHPQPQFFIICLAFNSYSGSNLKSGFTGLTSTVRERWPLIFPSTGNSISTSFTGLEAETAGFLPSGGLGLGAGSVNAAFQTPMSSKSSTNAAAPVQRFLI
ncbi:MAG: hypothetical protein KA004_01315 [Verrucomicrobiales bacterium]|nr:hypothetical protein [Verrucomicrobiales bacterium]